MSRRPPDAVNSICCRIGHADKHVALIKVAAIATAISAAYADDLLLLVVLPFGWFKAA